MLLKKEFLIYPKPIQRNFHAKQSTLKIDDFSNFQKILNFPTLDPLQLLPCCSFLVRREVEQAHRATSRGRASGA